MRGNCWRGAGEKIAEICQAVSNALGSRWGGPAGGKGWDGGGAECSGVEVGGQKGLFVGHGPWHWPSRQRGWRGLGAAAAAATAAAAAGAAGVLGGGQGSHLDSLLRHLLRLEDSLPHSVLEAGADQAPLLLPNLHAVAVGAAAREIWEQPSKGG